MRRTSREINTLSLSALDLFATAMGAFAIIMLILFPHYLPVGGDAPKDAPPLTKNPRADRKWVNSLGMEFVPVATGPGALAPASPTASPSPKKEPAP
jgi:hypothetical protein